MGAAALMHSGAGAASGGGLDSPSLAALDVLTASEPDADQLAQRLAAALVSHGAVAVTVATHWARVGEQRHVALSIEASAASSQLVWSLLSAACTAPGEAGLLLGDRYRGPVELRASVEAAAAAHRTRTGGRVVVFPGSAELSGTKKVADVLRASVVDRVRVLAGSGDADPSALLHTRDFVRPLWSDGELVLHTQPALGRTLVPFETPSPTPCCADHARQGV